ncbi:MAG: hypothetical protein MJ147_07285 [Clostridia bacterium]|nr:hypothetical protein [Clostridia bacterium]
MLSKILSFIASFVMLFQFMFTAVPAVKQSPDVLKEPQPQSNPLRTFDKIEGVSGSEFYIERPSTELKEVKASQFGVDANKADNFNEIKKALEYCANNPNTKLTFSEGTYYLDNKSQLLFKGMRNILIDGNGARLVFSNVVIGLEINGSDCVEFNNIKFDWDWEKHPLSDIVTVRNASAKNNTLEFVFDGEKEVSEDTIFAAISQCDPDTLTYGAKYSNKEVYVYQRPDMIKSVKKIDKNVLQVEHDGSFGNFKNGDKFILRHYVYDTTFAVLDNESKNITFDNVSVYGYPGSGFLANSKASHFQIINSYIGVEPDKKAERHTSLGADAIHIANSDGCFNIANCDISGQGDDALNVHDGLGWVKSIDRNKITLEATAVYMRAGDVLKFRDALFNETDATATIKDITYSGAYYDITFTENVSDKIGLNYIAYDLSCSSENYVVRDNYIHENRARGFLLQSPNGLCENNRFYKTEMQAIKIVMDISPGLWYEGTGVDNLEIKGNEFLMCDYIATGEVITIGSNISGKTATSEPFTNIRITDNTFKEFPERVLNADNVNGLTFTGNTVDAGSSLPKSQTSARAYFGEYCDNITFENNQWQNCIAGEIAKSKKPSLWAIINSK